ncbi:MAG: S8 family serine peptidase, partial [Acidobacteriota bacterium]|nr:S8 family serine peptidase [Acidobacteriota bacterium]
MRNTKLWTIAWVTALATASPVAAAPALGATTETYLVYTEHGRKAPANVQPLANYGTAVLAPLSASDAAELASQGFRITRLEDPTWIRLPGRSFDTRAGEPALPNALRATATDARAPYLVQFVGPLHPMWRQQVSDAGGTFARYGHVNNNAWVVSMDGTAAAAVSQQPFVRWLGHYHPAFKISAELTEIAMRNDADPEAEPISVLLQVYAAADISRAIQDVKSQGGTVHAWGPDDPNSRVQPYLTAEVKPSEIARLAALPEVAWLQQRPVFELLTEQAAQSMQSGACGLACTSRTVDDVPWWRDGLTGAGPAPSCGATAGTEQIIGVMDSGIEAHTDFEACPGPGCTILAVESQISAGSCGNAAPVSSCTDLDGHGTSVSGIISGSGAVSGGELPVESCSSKGLAFGGRLDVEVCGPNLECLNACDPNLTLASFFQRTYGRGSRMSNHSWGADLSGAYDALAQTVDTWAWDNNGAQPGTPQEYLWAFAAGNAGPWPGTIGSPGTAKDVLAVAAVYNGLDGSCWSCDSLPCTDCDKLVCYSSRGPTQDGRHGPHIAGLSQCITAPDLFGGYNACFNGTSAATPTVTATAAQVRDWWIHEKGVVNPSGSLVKAALLNSGEPIQDPATTVPDEAVGWGRVQLDNLWDSADPDLNVLWLDETNGVTTGGLSQFTFAVRSGNRPLRAMLVWMDYPATAGVGGLVNDLDLFVREPNDAACYRGNDATGNESNPVSCAAPGVFDGTNNDEGVRVSNPVPGRWTVEVRAANVPNGPQPFALVIGGDVVQCESPPPAPIGVGAAPAGPNSMTVSWNPVAGADRYYVYRSDGACPGTQFQFVGSTLGPSTSFTDVDLSGGSSYSYYVQALTPDGCISEASTCADAVATGDCTLPPTFAGLESVVDDDTAACGLTLGWTAAISNCPLFPTMTYNVYRSTDSAFVPGPETLRDTCASGTSYNDSEVSDGVTYYYAVRAEDSRPSGGTGDCQGGNQESNAVRRSGSPTSNDYVAGVFHDDGGDTGRAKLIADDPWYVTSLKNHTPGGLKAYRAGDTITQNCAALTTPVLRLDPAAS